MRLTPMRRAFPLVIAIVLIASPSARAELIVLRFTGTITAQEGDRDPAIRALFPIGGAASWILTYDSNTSESGLLPEFLSDPSNGFYDSTSISWQGEIAGHSVLDTAEREPACVRESRRPRAGVRQLDSREQTRAALSPAISSAAGSARPSISE